MLLKEWLVDQEAVDYQEIHHIGQERLVERLMDTELPAPSTPVFKKDRNYLIVGGTGYIGGLMLEQIARKSGATLFILSRSAFNKEIEGQFEKLRSLGTTPHHYQVDVTDLDKLKETYAVIKSQVDHIHGVINLARAHDTNIIASKSWESFHKVSLVKIQSAQYLDELTKDEPLDFFIMFTAMAAFGATGESDYAYSGAFQNAFVKYRNQLVAAGRRSGTSVSQCWGPWEEDKLFPGHVQKWKSFGCDLIDMASAFPLIEATCIYPHGDIGINAVFDEQIIRDWFGIVRQTTETAPATDYEVMISAWEDEKRTGKEISLNDVQSVISVAVMESLPDLLVERIYELCFGGAIEGAPTEEVIASQPNDPVESVAVDVPDEAIPQASQTVAIIAKTVSEVLEIDDLDHDIPFQDYGLDSIIAMRLSTKLEKKLNREIMPQLLIEFPTVNELKEYLENEDKSVLI